MIVASLPPVLPEIATESSTTQPAERLLFIQQVDHAHLAADFLALVNFDDFPRHPLRDELILAAREHDNGWAEFDSAPSVQADGSPHDFLSVATEQRQEIWHLGVERHVQEHPVAALLITQHALHLHRRRHDDPEWSNALDRWRQLRDRLLTETGVDENDLLEAYTWLDLADSVSLAACIRSSKPYQCGRFTLTPDPDDNPQGPATVGIHPFPLAGSTLFQVNARRTAKRLFRSDSDLAVELAIQRWQRLSVRLRPGPPG